MITGCCAYDTDCDDLDPCTVDSCDPVSNSCSFVPSGDCSDAGIPGTPDGDGGITARVNAIDEHTLEGGCALAIGTAMPPSSGAIPLLASVGQLLLLLLLLLGGRRRAP
jgi:hypothetical protein